MTVKELSLVDGFYPLVISDGTRSIDGVYIGDLLSWVMGKAQSGDAWLTIMSNINILAVASLSDVACIILTEGVVLDEEVIKTAWDKEINIISTKLSSYEASVILSDVL